MQAFQSPSLEFCDFEARKAKNFVILSLKNVRIL